MITEKAPWETVYSMITELNNTYLSQSRQINNTLATMQKTLIDLNGSVELLAVGLQERHQQRNQLEIDKDEADLETLRLRIQVMEKQVQEKKENQVTNKTSQDIAKIAQDTFKSQQQAEAEKSKSTWEKRKEQAVTAIVVTFAVGIAITTFIVIVPLAIQFLQQLLKYFE